MDNNEYSAGLWALISAGPMRVLGRITGVGEDKYSDAVKPEDMVKDVMEANYVRMNPTYDFFAPLQPTPLVDREGQLVLNPNGSPRMGMSRSPIVTARDFTLKPYPVHIILGPGVFIDFIHEMHEDDQQTYIAFMAAAANQARELSAAKSSIVLAGPGDMPPGRRGR